MAKTTDKDGNPVDFETFRKQAYDEILKGKSLNRSRRCPNSPDQRDRPGLSGRGTRCPPC